MAWVHLLNELRPLLNTTREEITFLESKYVAKLDQIESSSPSLPSPLPLSTLQLFVLSLLGSMMVNYLNTNFFHHFNLSMSDQMNKRFASVGCLLSLSEQKQKGFLDEVSNKRFAF